ncbi:conserved Plasmodium protein, unknown function [Plasmodium knowlesi strain H]|uniref:Uncharacterized protein n=3 Tax=Plasmodium knowlesi TaxID=5850 RepID=A0A5K1V5L3_PLAKH|nr:conserved protein, unknown function [Plasmodium knowlesi strain H]OTN66934.1 Uncharacterized protein PKNOH_S07461700 [Plasmodium knowlesi]CAA9988741.1 conserved protein, unknown function [Plasmodium knowlesi strain H]SBO21691.1 conserved Plasmodium protein, unknown function [Plasmodium knowlesi strain H]SBO22065.1 conserved Plasmodium protein, unknown function [Plasmodium knowlesi strain H]VVS78215.1 conserved protein, unknown function [Plasmodium knowlesi strain H]|eukprot:XP_002259717.1 hypothetical protein, conserved in Plasmodium species [Plasmodium knowlesi strain H]
MSEDGEVSPSKPLGSAQIDEEYIQSEIDKLNVEELVQPEQNNALKRVIRTDRKIVTYLDSKISTLHKSCQYGTQVSKIINFKAEGLSSISLKEKLKLILESLSGEFSDEGRREMKYVNQGKEEIDALADEPGESSPDGRAKQLSFTKLSKHFSVDTLPFCSINYDTIPLSLFLDNQNTFCLQRKEQKRTQSRSKHTLGNTSYRKLREFTHENEPEIKLETYEQSMRLKEKLEQLEKKKENIPFLKFIIDCDPVNGFNETTFRLFLVTLLVSKGHIEFYRDANKVLCIRTSNLFRHTEERPNGDDADRHDDHDGNHDGSRYSARHRGETLPPRKNQALLTAWSYEKWEKLVKRLAPHR